MTATRTVVIPGRFVETMRFQLFDMITDPTDIAGSYVQGALKGRVDDIANLRRHLVTLGQIGELLDETVGWDVTAPSDRTLTAAAALLDEIAERVEDGARQDLASDVLLDEDREHAERGLEFASRLRGGAAAVAADRTPGASLAETEARAMLAVADAMRSEASRLPEESTFRGELTEYAARYGLAAGLRWPPAARMHSTRGGGS